MSRLKPISSIDIIMASQAKWKSNVLSSLGIQHRCVTHRYEEPQFSGKGDLPKFIEDIAVEKGRSLENIFFKEMIVSTDQLITYDGDVFGKPGSRGKAIQQLSTLNGKVHELICALAVTYQGKTVVRHETAKLKMRDLSLEEIIAYVDKDEPWSCAGSYKIESLGASLFEYIDTRDPNTIIGLPANLMIDMIREWGFTNLL